nr:Com family DNA-binding transcriptional regulator [Pseudodesulfovibrio sp.]
MKEFRCWNCNRLLAKENIEGEIRIKCPKCKRMNNLRIKNPCLKVPRDSQDEHI